MKTSVVIVTTNEGDVLLECLRSLEQEAREGVEAIVVNNGDVTPAIEEAGGMAFVKVLPSGGNIGFAAACNLGARHASGGILFFLNPDTVVAPGALAALARVLEDETIGIAMPRVRLLDRPDTLNSYGNVVHISGLAWSGGYGEPAEMVTELRDIPFPSGAAMAMRAELFRELGGFTEKLFIYQEDLELGWRAHLRGLRVVVTPDADVYHDYAFSRNPRKLYLLERNRLVFVLSAFSPRLLLVLAPVLVSAELSLFVLALKEGWAKDKAAGWLWCVRNTRWLARHRKETQRLRRVPDRELARFLTPTLAPAMIEVPRAARAANPLLTAYWRVTQRLL